MNNAMVEVLKAQSDEADNCYALVSSEYNKARSAELLTQVRLCETWRKLALSAFLRACAIGSCAAPRAELLTLVRASRSARGCFFDTRRYAASWRAAQVA